jgi:hypothetical protein
MSNIDIWFSAYLAAIQAGAVETERSYIADLVLAAYLQKEVELAKEAEDEG